MVTLLMSWWRRWETDETDETEETDEPSGADARAVVGMRWRFAGARRGGACAGAVCAARGTLAACVGPWVQLHRDRRSVGVKS